MSIFNFDWLKRHVNQYIIYNTDSVNSILSNTFYTVDVSDALGQHEAYLRTPIINTIIDKMARMGSYTQPFVENLKSEISNTPQAKELLKLLESPNGSQGLSEFVENYITNLKIFGEVFILPISLEGLKGVKGFTILPNHKLTIEMEYNNYPFQVSKTNNIKTITLSKEDGEVVDLTEFKDMLIVICEMQDKQKIGRGISKFISLQDHVNKYLIAVNANKDILENYGALGIWVNQGKDDIGQTIINDKDREEIYSALDKGGLTTGKRKNYVSSHNLRHEKISLPIRDLLLDETTKDSVRTICDSLGYSIDLLGFDRGSSLQASGGRETEAKRQVYNENIIPTMQKMAEQMSKLMLPPTEQLKFYFDHLDIFQKSIKELAEGNKMQVELYNSLLDKEMITPQEYKEILINLEILK